VYTLLCWGNFLSLSSRLNSQRWSYFRICHLYCSIVSFSSYRCFFCYCVGCPHLRVTLWALMWFAPVCMFCSHAPVTVRWLWLPSILVVRFNCLEVTAVPMNVRPVPCSPRLPARLLLLLLHPPVRVGIQLVSSILLPQITMDLLQHCFLLCGNGHLTFTEIYFRP